MALVTDGPLKHHRVLLANYIYFCIKIVLLAALQRKKNIHFFYGICSF